jgi:hypothetical protein
MPAEKNGDPPMVGSIDPKLARLIVCIRLVLALLQFATVAKLIDRHMRGSDREAAPRRLQFLVLDRLTIGGIGQFPRDVVVRLV